MREPAENGNKAWSREYEEKPFFFKQGSAHGARIVAWSEDPRQIKKAFLAIVDSFPQKVELLLKIEAGTGADGRQLWARYTGQSERWRVSRVIKDNESYFLSDGAHQFCIRDSESGRYLAFDEHGIFFLYSPGAEDERIFSSLGFENRHAEPIYSVPHFHHVLENPEKSEMTVVQELELQRANSDLD